MLSQRARACFENNKAFEEEVGAALLPIGVGIMKQAMGVLSGEGTSALEKEYAQRAYGVGSQILSEQSIAIGGSVSYSGPAGVVPSGQRSLALQSIIRQLLRMPSWTMTPDQWIADEEKAAQVISLNLGLLLSEMLAQPVKE